MARTVAPLIDNQLAADTNELLDSPVRYLQRQAEPLSRDQAELSLLAVLRVATQDTDVAASLLDERWQSALGPQRAAWAWAIVAKQAALKLSSEAPRYYQRAWSLLADPASAAGWGHETLAWDVRSTLRATSLPDRWSNVLRAIGVMSVTEQSEPTWLYWRARALLASAPAGPEGDGPRGQARELLARVAGPLNFYAMLAADELGFTPELPLLPVEPSQADRDKARTTSGLARALQLIGLGLRDEGAREWNFTLRGMDERELLAAAQWACEREVWDRCISTSDRTRTDVNLQQRYPTPFRDLVLARAATRPAWIRPWYTA